MHGSAGFLHRPKGQVLNDHIINLTVGFVAHLVWTTVHLINEPLLHTFPSQLKISRLCIALRSYKTKTAPWDHFSRLTFKGLDVAISHLRCSIDVLSFV